MKKTALKKFLALLMAVSGLALTTGCQSTKSEQDGISSRPWSQPRGWESGVPGFIQNDRYR